MRLTKKFRRTDAVIEMVGVVLQRLPQGLCRVELHTGRQVIARIAGELRRCFVPVRAGDRVKLELSAFNFDQVRITGLGA